MSTHNELIDALVEKTKREENEIIQIITETVQSITADLVDGKAVVLPELGTIDAVMKDEFVVIHPETKQRTLVPPQFIITFNSTPNSLEEGEEKLSQDQSTNLHPTTSFINELSSTIGELLHRHSETTVDGLGVFQRKSDEEESASVTFIPDKSLIESVNAPFLQFKEVSLKEDVHLPDTDEIVAENVEQALTLSMTPQQSVAETNPETTDDKPEEIPSSELDDKMQNEQETQTEDDDNNNTEPTTITYHPSPQKFGSPSDDLKESQLSPVAEEGGNSRKGKMRKIFIPICIAVAVAALVLLIFAVSRPSESETDTSDTHHEAPITQQPTENEQKQLLIQQANSKLEWAPYAITDIYDTIVVNKVTTALTLAATYGGAGTEYYIKALNDGKAQFEAGEEVLIPIIELKEKRH